jgi:hypothetical protein
MTSTKAAGDHAGRSKAATVAAAVVAVVIAIHMAMTFAYNVPAAADRENTVPQVVDDYMTPTTSSGSGRGWSHPRVANPNPPTG